MVISADPKRVVPREEGESQHKTLEKQAARGTLYVVVYYGVSLSLRVVSSVILARLFSPEYFGVMTLLTTVLIGLNLFSHIGLADSVIQNPRGDDPVFLNTAWTLQVVRGAGLWLLTILLAWPVARFYHEPRTLTLFPALGFACVIAGASSPSLLTLARHLGVGKLSMLELLGQIVQFVVTLAWAFIQPSLWALVGGRLASELVRMVASSDYRAILLKYRLPVLAAGGLGLILIICTGDQVVLHLYDRRYRDAAWMVGVLAVGLWHTMLYSTVSPAILALSKAHYNAAANLVFCISLFVLIPLGFHYYGMLGAVAAVAVGDLPVYFVVLYTAYRENVGTFLQDAWMTVAFLFILASALALRFALGFGQPFQTIHQW
jgi:O-antigen/teichoic acid export membrane protein